MCSDRDRDKIGIGRSIVYFLSIDPMDLGRSIGSNVIPRSEGGLKTCEKFQVWGTNFDPLDDYVCNHQNAKTNVV